MLPRGNNETSLCALLCGLCWRVCVAVYFYIRALLRIGVSETAVVKLPLAHNSSISTTTRRRWPIPGCGVFCESFVLCTHGIFGRVCAQRGRLAGTEADAAVADCGRTGNGRLIGSDAVQTDSRRRLWMLLLLQLLRRLWRHSVGRTADGLRWRNGFVRAAAVGGQQAACMCEQTKKRGDMNKLCAFYSMEGWCWVGCLVCQSRNVCVSVSQMFPSVSQHMLRQVTTTLL